MTAPLKLIHGTSDWFEMVGALLCDAALLAGLSSSVNLSLVERYTDGIALEGGLMQGLRFDIRLGKPSYRVGVSPSERADVTIHVTAAVAQALNSIRSNNPDYSKTVGRYLATSDMRVEGDLTLLGEWFASVHDSIVDRTVKNLTYPLPI